MSRMDIHVEFEKLHGEISTLRRRLAAERKRRVDAERLVEVMGIECYTWESQNDGLYPTDSLSPRDRKAVNAILKGRKK